MIHRVDKVWGCEEWIVNRDYCGKLLRISKGWQCSLHYHPIKHETFYLLGGRVLITRGECKFELERNGTVEIPPGTIHRFAGIVDSVILEISSHHDDNDVVRLEESCRYQHKEEWKWLT